MAEPWTPGESRLPKNIQTDKPYRGGNSIYLSVTQTAKGYSDHRWATYKQISDMGGQVRKGEKATHVLFYKFDDEKKTAQAQPGTPTAEGTAEQAHTRPPLVRCYAVFNVEQADGLTLDRQADDRTKAPEWKANQTAERVIQESGVHVAHVRGDRAFYNIHTDKVTLPEREQLATANGYYQTALHELGHATGHPARMDGDTISVRLDGARSTVRFTGIDTPETTHQTQGVEPERPGSGRIHHRPTHGRLRSHPSVRHSRQRR